MARFIEQFYASQKPPHITFSGQCSIPPLMWTFSHKIIFFPPNMTAVSQPMDQGVIQTLKLHYRSAVLSKLLSVADSCKSSTEFSSKVSVLDAIRWLRFAWDEVMPSTIEKCFCHAGIFDHNTRTSAWTNYFTSTTLGWLYRFLWKYYINRLDG